MDETQAPDEPTPRWDPDTFTILAVTFEIGLIPLAWFIAWAWPGPPVLTPRCTTSDLLVGIGATLPPLALFLVITATPLRNWSIFERIRDQTRKIIGEALARLQVWQMAAVAIAAGAGEEILFRGALVSRLGDGLLGICLAGILFGVLHWITPTYAVLAGIFGIFLGWLLLETDNLFVPIVVHGLYDFVALILIRRELRRDGYPHKINSPSGD